jgi:uncharacterized protein
VEFKDGVPHGEWTVHWQDGKVRAKREYVDGRPQGTWTIYAEDGQTVLEERQYENGLAHGKWVYNFPSGNKRIEEHHARGKRSGQFTEWNETGQVVREMGFKDGQLDGRAVIRAQGGTEIIQFYRDGQLVPDGPDDGGQ